MREEVQAVADIYDADVYVYSSAIDHEGFGKIVGCYKGSHRRNALLILTTNGGLANSAYKIARFFQTQYEQLIVVIPSVCKSAGTLLACGAHRLVMTPFSELGPLDVQLYARDEIGARRSGLLNHSAFEALKSETFELYEHFMLSIKRRSGDNISFPLASSVAGDMAAKLMVPVFEQISPEALGSDYRDLQVAVEYGGRLADIGRNISPYAVNHLTNGYPSHDFIIDADEARELFDVVDDAEPALWNLISLLNDFVFSEQQPGIVACLTAPESEEPNEQESDAEAEAEDGLVGGEESDIVGPDSQVEEGTEPSGPSAADDPARSRPIDKDTTRETGAG